MTTKISLSSAAWALLATGPLDALVTLESGNAAKLHIGEEAPSVDAAGHTLTRDRPDFSGTIADGSYLYGLAPDRADVAVSTG